MKVLFYTILIVTTLFFLTQAFAYMSVKNTEEHKYEVLKVYEDFEVRKYSDAIFSSVELNSSSYEESSTNGFRALAGYIFGGNDGNEKIAMTTPVAMELGDTIKMSFMVPSDYNMEDLPQPNNKRIYFEKKVGKTIAAMRYGGWSSDEKVELYKRKLDAAIKREGLKHNGKFIYLGYNPPFEVVNRRNEITVELVD